MSKMRKLISVLVALMMVVSMFALTANAAGYEDDETAAEYTQEWALGEPVDNGDGTYTVDVYLTTNYGTGPIQFVLTNSDTSVAYIASIEDVTLGDAIPESYNATVSVSKAKGKVMIIADTAGKNTIEAEEIDGVIATVVYTYAGSGSAEIAIEDDAKSATNVGGSLIAARMSDGDVVTGDPITGQTVTVGDSVIIGGAAPTLAVIDGMAGVIDTDRTEYGADFESCTGYIYGIELENGDSVDTVFEVIGDGELDWDGNNGTGSIVNVLDTDGNVVETYVVIIFGDIDGDGEITALDANIAELHEGWAYGDDGQMVNPEMIFAGDVDVDSEVTALDANIMELHEGWAYGDDGRFFQSEVIDQL